MLIYSQARGYDGSIVNNIQNFQEYFYWGASEDELIIDKLKEVEERVLSKYFRHTKLSSFIRQVTLHRFSSISMDFVRWNIRKI